jgi:rhodanese-related sulfurtransferase
MHAFDRDEMSSPSTASTVVPADTGRVSATHDAVVAARAGIENLTPAELTHEITGGGVVLVDVREPGETADGIIPSAVRIPRGVLEFRAECDAARHDTDLHPKRRVVLYSSNGARSALAAVTLHGLGYRDVAHLDGGLRAWIAAGGPVHRPGCLAPAPVELVAPDDRATFVRVQLDGTWVGDLLAPSPAERDVLLAALVGGGVSVLRRPVDPDTHGGL